jgi:hypothetical protein
MPDVYAGAELEDLADVTFTLSVIKAVRKWIGNVPWCTRVPLQRSQRPSFLFLSAAAEEPSGNNLSDDIIDDDDAVDDDT